MLIFNIFSGVNTMPYTREVERAGVHQGLDPTGRSLGAGGSGNKTRTLFDVFFACLCFKHNINMTMPVSLCTARLSGALTLIGWVLLLSIVTFIFIAPLPYILKQVLSRRGKGHN